MSTKCYANYANLIMVLDHDVEERGTLKRNRPAQCRLIRGRQSVRVLSCGRRPLGASRTKLPGLTGRAALTTMGGRRWLCCARLGPMAAKNPGRRAAAPPAWRCDPRSKHQRPLTLRTCRVTSWHGLASAIRHEDNRRAETQRIGRRTENAERPGTRMCRGVVQLNG